MQQFKFGSLLFTSVFTLSLNQAYFEIQMLSLLSLLLPGNTETQEVGPSIRAFAEAVADGVLIPVLFSKTS